jgi:hypothetical protein
VSARDLTAADLIRALGTATARPSVDKAVRERADRLAAAMGARAGEDDEVSVRQAGPADYRVDVAGPGLFAREYGGADGTATPVIGPAIDAARAKP